MAKGIYLTELRIAVLLGRTERRLSGCGFGVRGEWTGFSTERLSEIRKRSTAETEEKCLWPWDIGWAQRATAASDREKDRAPLCVCRALPAALMAGGATPHQMLMCKLMQNISKFRGQFRLIWI